MNWQEIVVLSVFCVSLFFLGKKIFLKIKKPTDTVCDKCKNIANEK